MKTKRVLPIALLLVMLVSQGCLPFLSGASARNSVTVNVTANTSLAAWLKEAVQAFNARRVKTASKQTISVNLSLEEAGQAVIDMKAGASAPALWIPDDPVWVDMLASQGNPNFQSDCASIATSPLVIGMWRPVAEALGWPGRDLGWLDIGSLAADPSSWTYYSGGQFGPVLRLGHTHPGLSASGASTLLAVVQAAQFKQTAVSAEDVKQPIVQASVKAFEEAVSWFSTDTDSLGSSMQSRGIGYLGAAVMYESTVVQYGSGDPGIVPIYPYEGTFMATHPACIDSSAGALQKEAAAAFRTYLLDVEAQTKALSNGLRPVNSSVPLGAPLDAAHGVDITRPVKVFEPARQETVYAVQELWQSSRKQVNLVMLLDTSGSMRGDKIQSVQEAAAQFVDHMGDKDYLTLANFSGSKISTLIDHQQVSSVRQQAKDAIAGLEAAGDTPLYDALAFGAKAIADSDSSQTTNVLVVLTDGMDTSSNQYRFDDNLVKLVIAHNTTVFTIAYGSDADKEMLSQLATKANGNFYQGNQANIAEIYNEMSAAFGGSLGIGR